MITLLKSQIWTDEIEPDGTHYIVTIDDKVWLLSQREWQQVMDTGSITVDENSFPS